MLDMATEATELATLDVLFPKFNIRISLISTRLISSEGQVFAVSEYVAFSLEEILHNGIHPTESEITYIVGQGGC